METDGRQFTRSDLVHATLYVEQVITTGGGYQDQVAGVFGGINVSTTALCHSAHSNTISDPMAVGQMSESRTDQNLHVRGYSIKMNSKDLDVFMSRIVLMYTGGGGGFLFVILKESSLREEVIRIGNETFQESFQAYEVEIDSDGIQVWIGNESEEISHLILVQFLFEIFLKLCAF